MDTENLLERLVALLLLPVVLVILAAIYVVYLPLQGGRFLYRSERMKTTDQSFALYKIRTMHPVSPFDGERVLGGDQSHRVTRFGRLLRRTRLDELPQIFNIIRGDMGFVGPRPPLRKYVVAFPDEYRQVLKSRPGVTGLATVIVCGREERLLSVSTSPEETDLIYRRSCIPLKLRLDLLYARHASPGLWVYVMVRTVFRGQNHRLSVLRRKLTSLDVAPAPGLIASHNLRSNVET